MPRGVNPAKKLEIHKDWVFLLDSSLRGQDITVSLLLSLGLTLEAFEIILAAGVLTQPDHEYLQP